MKLTFLGVSSALSKGHNSNILIDSDDGKTLLFDAGITLKQSLKDANRDVSEIDAVYISHLHSDHCGSMEWLGYYSMFVMKRRLTLYVHESLISDLWAMLRPAMEKLDGHGMVTLDEYFDVRTIKSHEWCVHRSLCFRVERQVHVETHHGNMYSYGLSLHQSRFEGGYWKPFLKNKKSVFISSDSKYIRIPPSYAYEYDLIFCDCDVMNLSGVHPNYDDLKNMTQDIKRNMWLYHYTNLDDYNGEFGIMPDAIEDGFRGFVKEGQVFEI